MRVALEPEGLVERVDVGPHLVLPVLVPDQPEQQSATLLPNIQLRCLQNNI